MSNPSGSGRKLTLSKTAPLGVCDLCGDPISAEDWYTSKGAPRRYCSIDCRNTANSRAGAHIIGAKTRQRIARGEWQNPAVLHPPSAAAIGAASRITRRREVAEGRWRNPGLTPEARAINSRPHKHTGALASAIERLRHGHVADLTPEEAEAHRAYRRTQGAAWRAGFTADQRSHWRSRWRAYWRKRHPHG